jgi:RNA polymerase sigma factor (sigma-70 family)
MRQYLSVQIRALFDQFLRAYEPRCGVPLRAYLVRTLTVSAYSLVANHRRQGDGGDGLQDGLQDAATPELSSAVQDPYRRLREIVLGLPEAISALPLRQRQAVIWRYYDGCSLDAIAGLLRIEPASVRALLRRAIRQLRRYQYLPCFPYSPYARPPDPPQPEVGQLAQVPQFVG